MLNAMKSRLSGRTLLQTLFFFLLVTQLCFAQWTQVGLNDKSIKDIAVQNPNIFAVTSDSFLYHSVDNGANWTMIVDSNVVDVAITQTGKVFMVNRDSVGPGPHNFNNLYVSADNGNTWIWSNIREQLSDSLSSDPGYYYGYWPEKISISPTGNVFCDIFAYDGTWGWYDVIARSTDDGLTWTTPGRGVKGGDNFDFKNQFTLTVGIHYDGLVPPTTHYFVNLSSDYGITWSLLESGWTGNSLVGWPLYVPGLFTNGNIILNKYSWIDNVYVNELFISMDECSTWTYISSLNTQTGLSWSNGLSEGMLIGTDIGVFLFSDEGDSLGSRNDGLTNLNVQALTLDNNGYVYAGTGNGVWQRPLGEVTAVEGNQIENSSSYILSQNFPNPFNPSTIITYSLPQSSAVELKVYDILGNEIETLVNEVKPVGTYEITWYPDNLSSGIYFYQLKAGVYLSTKKMILIK